MDWRPLERAIGYDFSRPELLSRSLTHRSCGNPHNERLEFLGDSVLNCVIAAELYDRFDKLSEGDLTVHRTNLVRQQALHRIAQGLALGDFLLLGEGELKSGGYTRPSILADALEALIGAVFLDGGFGAARSVICGLYADLLRDLDPKAIGKDPKTLLQELLQARRIALPRYTVISTIGAAHSQQFQVECTIPELDIRTTGSGVSRRVAEQEAALLAFEKLGK